MLQTDDEEVPPQCTSVQLHSPSCTEDNSDAAATQCGTVMAVHLEGPLEVVHSLAGMGSRAAQQASVCTTRMLVQPPREELVTMRRDNQLQKQTKGDMPSKGPWCLR